MRDRAVRFVFEGTDKNLAKTTENVTKHVGLLHAAFRRLGRGIELGAAIEVGRRAVEGVFEVIKSSVEIAEQAEKVNRRTANVIATTGGAAHVTAGHVADYATKLSNLTGVNRETVQGSENVLLIFTAIQNRVGKGNNIFDRATATALDMSQALGKGLTPVSIALGKALQDPIKGMTALRRVGVIFTADQQKQIATMVKSGHTLEAQKFILAELAKRFGGAAAAMATPFERLKNTFHNVELTLGQALLPVFNVLLGLLARGLPVALHTVTGWFGRLLPLWRAFVQGFHSPGGDVVGGGLLASLVRFGQATRRFVDENGPKVHAFFVHLRADIGDFAARNGPSFIRAVLLAGKVLLTLGQDVAVVVRWMSRHKTLVQSLTVGILTLVAGVKAYYIVQRAITLATKAWAAAQALLDAAMNANPLGVALIATIALAAGLIYAYKHSATFRAIVTGAFHAVSAVAMTVYNWIRGHWPLLLTVIAGPIGVAAVLVIKHWAKIRAAAVAAWHGTIDAVHGIVAAYNATVHAAGNTQHAVVASWQAIRGAALATWHGIVDAVHAIEAAWRVTERAAKALAAIITLGFLEIIAGALRMAAGILGALARIPGPWQRTFRAARDATNAELAKVEDKIHHAQSVVNSFHGKSIAVGVQGTVHWDKNAALLKSLTGNFTHKLPAFGVGGLVGVGTTPTADDVLVRVSKGEAVIPAQHVPALAPTLAALGIPGFAGGGLVGQLGLTNFPPLVGTAADALTRLTRQLLQQAAVLQLAHRNFPTGGGPIASGPLATVAAAVLRALHRPMSELAGWLRRVMFESGGRADAVNRSDSNWPAHPSVGLAQVIRGTFAAYANGYRNVGPFAYGVSENPFANMFAGANYAVHTYGSLAAVDPRVRPFGYRMGAWNILADQLAMVHRGEMVVPEPAASAVRARGARGGAGVVVHMPITVQGSLDRAAAEYVNRHVDDKLRELYRTLVAA